MSALLTRLDAHKPALWLEVAPPRGIAVESMLTRLAEVRGHVDAINLADNALGLLHRVSRVISQHGCDVGLVLISTEGHRAIDVRHEIPRHEPPVRPVDVHVAVPVGVGGPVHAGV